MKRNRTDFIRIAVVNLTIAGILLGIGAAMDFDRTWYGTLVPFAAAAALLVYERITSARRKAETEYYDLSEFQGHESVPADALEALFVTEDSRTGFTMPVAVEGIVTGGKELEAPCSGRKCIAWRLRVGLVRGASDARRKRESRPLLLEQEAADLHVGSDKVRVPVTGKPVLHLRDCREEFLSWDALKKRGGPLEDRIQNAVKLEGVGASRTGGVRIEEQALESGKPCTVYAVCRKGERGVLLEGHGEENDPESLYITDVAPKRRREIVERLRRGTVARRAAAWTLAATLALTGILVPFGERLARSALFNPGMRGQIRCRESPTGRIVALTRAPEGGEPSRWTIARGTDGSFTRLYAGDGQTAAEADRNDIIEIFDRVEESRTYEAGKDRAIEWKGVYWFVSLPDALPENTSAEALSGRIYVKNETDRTLDMKIRGNVSADVEARTWGWDPYEGRDRTYGIWASYTPAGAPKGAESQPVLLATGDSVILQEKGKPQRRFLLGYAPEIRFIPEKGWYLPVTEENLAARELTVRVANPSPFHYGIEALNPNGTLRHLYPWDIDPAGGAGAPDGSGLTYDEGGQTKHLTLTDGQKLRLIRTSEKSVWKGPLGSCPYAGYDRATGTWTVDVAGAAAP